MIHLLICFYCSIFNSGSVGSKPKKVEVIEVPVVVEVSAVDLAKEREEKKKQEKLLRKEAERLEKI